MNPVRELVAKRISELKDSTGLTMAEISRQLDRNPAYLQQFVSRGVPTELDERDRHKLAEILQLNPDNLRGPGRTRKWQRSELRSSLRSSLREASFMHFASHGEHRISPEIVSNLASLLEHVQKAHESGRLVYLDACDSLPVHRLVSEGDSLRISIQALTVLRKELRSNFGKNAYGVEVIDDSMSPEIRNGTIAIADPDLPCRPNTTCIFRKGGLDEGGEVLIRRLQQISEDNFQVFSYDNFAKILCKFESGTKFTKQSLDILPERETLSRKLYPHCHVIVGTLSPPVT